MHKVKRFYRIFINRTLIDEFTIDDKTSDDIRASNPDTREELRKGLRNLIDSGVDLIDIHFESKNYD